MLIKRKFSFVNKHSQQIIKLNGFQRYYQFVVKLYTVMTSVGQSSNRLYKYTLLNNTKPCAPKKLVYTCLFIIIVGLYSVYYILRSNIQKVSNLDLLEVLAHDTDVNMKYILLWTLSKQAPFDFLGQGCSVFTNHNCEYTNCFITDNRNYFDDMKHFDAIAFNGVDVSRMNKESLPESRSPKQKYIFGAMESSHIYPVCNKIFNNYFNWTWTYRLDSDFRWGYVTVYDLNGTKVGPMEEMNWPVMEPISDDLKQKLENKTKSVAWFVSNCRSKSRREKVASSIALELKKYNLSLDIYGACGELKCPRSDEEACFKMLENDYYFYLSFENSFAEDYVTEKVMNALDNFVVPVVYGGANYSRFLPPGSYLDVNELGVKEIVRTINGAIINSTAYHDFFKWRNHFKYKLTSGNVDICTLCAELNNESKMNETSVHENFIDWWNPEGICNT